MSKNPLPFTCPLSITLTDPALSCPSPSLLQLFRQERCVATSISSGGEISRLIKQRDQKTGEYRHRIFLQYRIWQDDEVWSLGYG